ncbi:MAG: single-stranded-DNA-specific exonuclease RecJ [Rickettsiales bacterium]|jgi:single-stranded-DNA-specific exonuclease|nr:single-stranded-DNA-specific exonuclease RecJ [Rickettsiales bacterium]
MRNLCGKSLLDRQWLTDDVSKDTEDLVSRILAARGITDSEDIRKFLNPSLKESMPDPFVLKDMQRGVNVVADAVRSGKKIAIFGDYDVDGITSTAIMLKYLRALGSDPLWHLPTREGEGYGLNEDAIREFADNGAEILITVDCGISAASEVALAKSLNMSVVITDHHNADGILPDADAVINPKRPDDESGLSYLAGVGVAFMFLVALNRELKKDEGQKGKRTDGQSGEEMSICPSVLLSINLMDYLDLVALGTVCDMMPLIGLNRAFVARGLEALDARKNLGLKTLMQVAGVKSANVYSVGFAIGPRLNAAGRLDSAAPALELMLADNPLIANDLANLLNKMNAERMEIQNQIMLDAAEMADEMISSGRRCLTIFGENWHGGIMGIVAGRLKDKYNMPTLVAAKSNGSIDGSGRSIPSVDLGKIIRDAVCAGVLIKGGGHAVAAGFALDCAKESEFCEFIESAVRGQLGDNPPASEIIVDAELDAGGATLRLIRELSGLAPFGQGNPEPTLVLNGATLSYASVMGNGSHLRGTVRTSAGTLLAFVGFNLVGTPVGDFLLDDANTNTKIRLCGKLKENDYNGRITAQFVLEDVAL